MQTYMDFTLDVSGLVKKISEMLEKLVKLNSPSSCESDNICVSLLTEAGKKKKFIFHFENTLNNITLGSIISDR